MLLALAACTPKMSDAPDMQITVKRDWASFTDCAYADLITIQKYPPANVTVAKVDDQKRGVVTATNVNGEFGYIIEARGQGDRTTVVSTRSAMTIPGQQSWDAKARITVANCTPRS